MTEPNASTAILDAAERVFALHGFDGASMRQIATEAGVAQALLHYHFGTKEKLYEAMFARRSDAINALRAAELDRLFGPEGQGKPALGDLLEALFRPTVEFGHEGQAGNLFSRVLAATANADDERSRTLIAAHYDAIARRFIEAFRRILPQLDQADAVWSYMFAIGVGMTMMSATGRAGRLSGGVCDDGDVDAVMARLVPFISAGIEALAAGRAAGMGGPPPVLSPRAGPGGE
ncbi:TetR family transcriptional regulator [Pigmentiphaga sp. NML080357]|uniref:TetR/AcrR family transcriptional regulator n=1 Tax=Pigmentiphaga sp. NML080357 TaxID=2008675 RepID=UPI000B40E9A3|nr:TetR/AcrR family transcriptional regulator [Pigmentiphaga sp. NML080357]OVZ54121.1 TetR family transcriptional regulator [Pigmentiphaga sp. NML080357]